MTTKLFFNARICTPRDQGRPAAGGDQGKLLDLDRGAMLVKNGLVLRIGPEREIMRECAQSRPDQEIDCGGRCMVPGFVDPHTHMCFSRLREKEFEMRIGGISYLEILKQGGGIHSSVADVKNADENELYEKTRERALSALKFGTTAVEMKSGYGLDLENELKMLRVIDRVGRTTPLDVVATFLGAHAVPKAFKDDPDAYVDIVIEQMLPAVEKQGIARHCDVFCERGVFGVDQARRILKAARKLGMKVKLHADEVNDLGGAGLAAELNAVSADHLLAAGRNGIAKMAASGVVAVLLPATAYSLRKPYAKAGEMIEAGVAVALATDCNPGSSFTESMPFVIGLAVMQMGMTPSEALVASTLNAAHAAGIPEIAGSLDPGKQADFLLLEGSSPAIIAYHAGVSPVTAVYKRGEQIF